MRNLLLDEQIRETNPVTIRRNDRLWRDNAGFGIDLAQQEYDERQRRVEVYAHLAKLKGLQDNNAGFGVSLADGSQQWDTCTQAAKALGGDVSVISRSAKTNGRLKAGGYSFVFTDPTRRRDAELAAARYVPGKPGGRTGPARPIVTDFGEEFPSLRTAAIALGVHKTTVHRAVLSGVRLKCAGRIVRYSNS